MNWLDLIGWTHGETPLHVSVFRVLIAGVFGAVIGFERERRNRNAGLRTHILVSTAAALFTVITFEIYHTILQEPDGSSYGDPIRAIEAVTAGVAFLGAGAIFRHGESVHGLTTGAGMWLAGAVGVACATGFYGLALLATCMAILVLWLLGVAEANVSRKRYDGTKEGGE